MLAYRRERNRYRRFMLAYRQERDRYRRIPLTYRQECARYQRKLESYRWAHLLTHRPLNSGALFSEKASRASRLSSVGIVMSYAFPSIARPDVKSVFMP